MPSDEDIAKLRALLLEEGTPGAMAASDRLDQLEDWEAVRRTWDAALAKVVSDPRGRYHDNSDHARERLQAHLR